jgi:lysozyme
MSIDSGPALTMDNEGYREGVYLDSLGYPTTGYGFCLDSSLVYQSVKDWHEHKFREMYKRAETDCESYHFDLDPVRRAAVCDLLYNLGPNRFAKFYGFISALKAKDWEAAVHSLENSLWYKQVGRRGPRITNLIKHGNWDTINT